MQSGGSLERRGRALEDEFFHRVDQQLEAELRAKMAAELEKKTLSETCGLRDPALIETLVHAGIKVETLAALMLVPLVRIAWADGRLEPAERNAVLRAAQDQGCGVDSGPYQLLQSWLAEAPPASLTVAWKEYVHALPDSMDATALTSLRSRIMTHARAIAQAAGGFLGIHTISATEQAVLDDIAATLGG